MSMGARLFPHPILSVVIAIVWLLLVNDFSLGQVLMAVALGLIVPFITAPFWPDRARVRNPVAIVGYGLIVIYDIILSNIQVAQLVLFRRGESLRSAFITVPLDLRSAEAIAALSGTITLTPGTLSADLSADGRSLLVHCLEVDDAEATVASIKDRYERRLKEIFE